MEEQRDLKLRQAFLIEANLQGDSSDEDFPNRSYDNSQRQRKHVDGEIQEKFEIYSISGKLKSMIDAGWT